MPKTIKINILLLFYCLATLLHIIGITNGERSLMLVFKPLIMPALMLIYVWSTSKINYWFLLGLFFSFLGDVFLLFEGELYFILGLGSFLLAHIVYIKIIINKIGKLQFKEVVISLIPFVALLIILLYNLYSKLGEMLVPVVIYAVTISLFGTFALYHYRKVKSTKALLLLLGACIFIASDTTIAINKFLLPRVYFEAFIMVTYALAQYLICKSLIEEKAI